MHRYTQLEAALKGIALIKDAPMSHYTSFCVGGPAKLLIEPSDEQELNMAIANADSIGIPYYIIGNGTNLLVSDRGIDGLVIRIGERMAGFDRIDNTYTVKAGTLLSVFSKATVKDGFMGLEWASGIPGSIGGAVAMNAGAYGGETSGVLREVTCLEHGAVKVFQVSSTDFGYRHSPFSAPDRIVLNARFELIPDDGKAADRMADYAARRREKQPLKYPSAGSTFKRPEGSFAGMLIENAGLKGESVGKAQVSTLHAGFIINNGGASAFDIYRLIKLVQQRVADKTGIMLEPEVRFLGDFSEVDDKCI